MRASLSSDTRVRPHLISSQQCFRVSNLAAIIITIVDRNKISFELENRNATKLVKSTFFVLKSLRSSTKVRCKGKILKSQRTGLALKHLLDSL